MYEEATKCNANLGYNGEDEDWEQTTDSTTCSFINAVQKGNIDKYGFVQISTHEYFSGTINGFNNNVLPEGFYLSDNQFFLLLTCSVMSIAFALYTISSQRENIVNTNTDLKAALV